ncbi:S1C family serine protease [Candidatus Omnitrophota bacterium]
MPSIVGIQAENAKLAKTKAAAIKDPKTGRIAIARGVRASTFNREGAGVIIDQSGLIVTNAHTIQGANRIVVTLHNKTQISADVISLVANEDIAFIHIASPLPLTPIAISNSNNVKLGDKVYTVGNSEFLDGTISGGRITGLGKKDKYKDKTIAPVAVIQTSFNVYKGDSGGPLLDKEGKLLGLIVARRTKSSHVSLAIPSSKIMLYYKNMLESKTQ